MMRPIEWSKLFAIDTPITEIVVRGTVVYLALFVLFRFILKREAGSLGIADLLVVVIVADAAQNAMAGDYLSITDGLVLVATIAAWNYLFDWLGYRYSWFERLLRQRSLELVRNGVVNRSNLRAAMITIEELKSLLREEGIDQLRDVKSARLEGDGKISVVPIDESETAGRLDAPTP